MYSECGSSSGVENEGLSFVDVQVLDIVESFMNTKREYEGHPYIPTHIHILVAEHFGEANALGFPRSP
jgi:hypothetical protein